MRALLVVNPKATTTSERSRDVLVRALRSEVGPDGRVHPPPRARRRRWPGEAAESGVDVVVTLGGDGTVNEVGERADEGPPATLPRGDGPPADRLPALAVVPGGSTNVFARASGCPRTGSRAPA